MSGGSLNYLYNKDTDELFTYQSLLDLYSAADILGEHKYKDVEKDVRRLIEYIQSARTRVEVLHELLAPVLKGVEWFDCHDIGEDNLAQIIEKYRTGDEQK